MGLTLAEIRRDMDEMLAFAEVERFANLKLKHYSTGMASRLAYAVAFQAVRDVLVLDEVFAVGDAGFRERCEERYRGLRARGHSVVIVSHSPALVSTFCDRAVLLEGGRVACTGAPSDVAGVDVSDADESRTLTTVPIDRLYGRFGDRVRLIPVTPRHVWCARGILAGSCLGLVRDWSKWGRMGVSIGDRGASRAGNAARGLSSSRGRRSRSRARQVIVEVGSFLGCSAVLLAGAGRIRGSGRVHCVDPFDGGGDAFSVPVYQAIASQLDASIRECFDRNVRSAGLSAWVTAASDDLGPGRRIVDYANRPAAA